MTYNKIQLQKIHLCGLKSELVVLYYFRVQEESEEKRESLVLLALLDLLVLKVPPETMVLKAAP